MFILLLTLWLFLFRVISCEEGKALAESWNAAFMESSAKENQVRAEDMQMTFCIKYFLDSQGPVFSRLIYLFEKNTELHFRLKNKKSYWCKCNINTAHGNLLSWVQLQVPNH